MKTRTRRVMGWGIAVLVLVFVLLCLPFDPPKLSPAEIGARVDLLNEKAAVVTPHFDLGKATRAAHLALFEKVEQGVQLSPDESAQYRVLYQLILQRKQRELSKLDSQLTVLTDYQPAEKNNVGTHG